MLNLPQSLFIFINVINDLIMNEIFFSSHIVNMFAIACKLSSAIYSVIIIVYTMIIAKVITH